MVKISLSGEEYKYLRNYFETEDIRYDSIKASAKRNGDIKNNSKIVDSLKEKFADAKTSDNYSF